MTAPSYTLTNETIMIVHKGKQHTIKRGAPNFAGLRRAILDELWGEVEKHFTVSSSLKEWAKGKYTVSVNGDALSFDGRALPPQLNARILQMATAGENPTPVLKFWERLQLNPSMRSIEQLWPFLDHKGIPLTDDGCFLAYKGVQQNWLDVHSGTFANKPGAVMKMPRNQISDDPNQACHVGFHVGALEYARSFGARTVICKVDPANVVCIPYDHSHQKMRVCEYEVIGEYGSQLPNTTYTPDEDNEIATGGDLESDGVPSREEEDELPDELPETKVDVKNDVKPKAKKKKWPAGLEDTELHTVSLEELRKYASKELKIVGAYKIPGGKTALISRIVAVRYED